MLPEPHHRQYTLGAKLLNMREAWVMVVDLELKSVVGIKRLYQLYKFHRDYKHRLSSEYKDKNVLF